MVKPKQLHDPPSIYQKEKTTIKKGEIIRKKVWVDSWGNELEKKGNMFYTKTSNDFLFDEIFGSLNSRHMQPQQDDLSEEIFLCTIFLIGIFLFGYLLGYFLGRRSNTQMNDIINRHNHNILMQENSAKIK